MSVAYFCIGLLALLLFVLGLHVSLTRGRTKINYGAEQDPQSALYKANRAHGNTAEYAPLLALMMFILAQSPQAEWVMWTMVGATFFRYLFVAGILLPQTMDKPNAMRFFGSLGTYLCGGTLAVLILLQAMS